jgi:hypothetical protein
MHVEMLVEEPSAEAALSNILAKVICEPNSFVIHAFQGKQDLLGKLSGYLKGYLTWMPLDMRIVVLVDEDRDDCNKLKARLEKIAADVGLYTKSKP